MKTHPHKLKTPPRPLFSCGFFRHCTQTLLSPTTTTPPPLSLSSSDPKPPPPLPPPPSSSDPPLPQPPQPESDSSSSSTSQSFTQWRFHSPISHHPHPTPPESDPPLPESDPPPLIADIQELFHVAELQLSSESDSDRVKALQLLERSLVRAATDCGGAVCPAAVMKGVVGYLKECSRAKAATKVLLALCLAEGNRRVAVEAGAVGAVVEAMAELEGAAAERALAALELLCTVAEGAAELRAHALAVLMMVAVMGKMDGRGKEYAISVLAVIYSGAGGEGVVAPPEEVARAVALALHGDCSARGRRKGAQLLRMLEESERLDLTQEEG
ncbi:U-box domain-containing protein 25 [Actinidia eriantha]|uniref:U-box domain-containing protein 25 n=1 Tax=Actinidia eriantha TaxID=165200 RepID=UPI00258C32B7|nr:U-box domain-containing protein 25 [Actinidia eriantha]